MNHTYDFDHVKDAYVQYEHGGINSRIAIVPWNLKIQNMIQLYVFQIFLFFLFIVVRILLTQRDSVAWPYMNTHTLGPCNNVCMLEYSRIMLQNTNTCSNANLKIGFKKH